MKTNKRGSVTKGRSLARPNKWKKGSKKTVSVVQKQINDEERRQRLAMAKIVQFVNNRFDNVEVWIVDGVHLGFEIIDNSYYGDQISQGDIEDILNIIRGFGFHEVEADWSPQYDNKINIELFPED